MGDRSLAGIEIDTVRPDRDAPQNRNGDGAASFGTPLTPAVFSVPASKESVPGFLLFPDPGRSFSTSPFGPAREKHMGENQCLCCLPVENKENKKLLDSLPPSPAVHRAVWAAGHLLALLSASPE